MESKPDTQPSKEEANDGEQMVLEKGMTEEEKKKM